jgi:nucleoid DNA-binding protein
VTTKNDLVAAVASALGKPQAETKQYVDAVFEQLGANLVGGNQVKISGFGVFDVKATKERVGRNPQTGAELRIPAGKKVVFKPAGDIREKL